VGQVHDLPFQNAKNLTLVALFRFRRQHAIQLRKQAPPFEELFGQH
jgi:hypothetical protein